MKDRELVRVAAEALAPMMYPPVTAEDICSPSRVRPAAEARWAMMYLLWTFDWKFVRIAKAMNRALMPTWYGVDKGKHLVKDDEDFRELVGIARQAMNGAMND